MEHIYEPDERQALLNYRLEDSHAVLKEMVLRELYLAENPADKSSKKKRPPSLFDLMQYAKKESWITNEGFSDSYQIARENAALNKIIEKSKTHDLKKSPQCLLNSQVRRK